jgi:hypothetical protein
MVDRLAPYALMAWVVGGSVLMIAVMVYVILLKQLLRSRVCDLLVCSPQRGEWC